MRTSAETAPQRAQQRGDPSDEGITWRLHNAKRAAATRVVTRVSRIRPESSVSGEQAAERRISLLTGGGVMPDGC